MLKEVKKGLQQGIGMVIILGITGVAYSAYEVITDVNTTDILTANTFNKVLENQRSFKSTLDNLSAGTTPSGAVMSFDLESCPSGWTEYAALRGKFIRGADTGANNDPNFTTRSGGVGVRKIGSSQGDATRLLMNGSSGTSSPEGDSPRGIIAHKPGIEMIGIEATTWGTYTNRYSLRNAMDTTYGGGPETRPKNIALLYCKKD